MSTMTFDSKIHLDDTAWAILQALQTDARLSYAQLGRRVNLSAPAVAERVRRLEEAGVIMGYRAIVDPAKLGFGLRALMDLTTTPQQYPEVLRQLEAMPEIRSCHHVTGQGSFRVEAIATSMLHLEQVIEQLSQFGQTATAIVLSTPLKKSDFERPSA